jgi:hypothetical protein
MRDGSFWDEIQMGVLRDEWLAEHRRAGTERTSSREAIGSNA